MADHAGKSGRAHKSVTREKAAVRRPMPMPRVKQKPSTQRGT